MNTIEKRQLSILIVDDSARMRQTIRAILGTADYRFHECDSGIAAVDLYPSVEPEWVLMDLAMPGITGIEATQQILALDPAARVIIVTDHAAKQFQDAAHRAGAVGFVGKDDLSKLIDLLR